MSSVSATDTKARNTRKARKPFWSLSFVAFVFSWICVGHAADDVRQIVDEAQRRTNASSQRYEGLLQVFDSKGKISDKRWTLQRLGSHGDSKVVLRFTAPAEVKGIALLVVNH